MFPDLFSIGPLTLHTYGLLVATGFVMGILVTIRIGKQQGISKQQIMDMGFIIILFAIIGSRLAFVLINISYYKTHPFDILKVWQGGLVFSGGIIAVIAAMVFYCRRQQLSLWQVGDLWSRQDEPASAPGDEPTEPCGVRLGADEHEHAVGR